MAQALKVPSIFTAIDKFSGPVNKMSRNANTAFAKMERRFRKVGDAAFRIGRKAAFIGLAIAAPLGLLVNEAIKFEDKMADVAKVANVAIGSIEFTKLGEQAKELSKFLAIDAKEAAGLMQNLAQGGVAIKDLDRISKIAGKVGVAFGITADIAGESFIKTKNALGGTIEQTEKLMDTINFLGDSTAASAQNILTFMASGGSGAARAAEASGEAMAAFGAQLISMGKSGEESATIMEKFIRTTLNAKKLRAIFDKAGGGAEGMMEIMRKGASLTGKEQDKFFKQFGNYGLSIQLLAKNFDGLDKTVDAATDTLLTQNSVLREFENRSNTSAFKLAQSKARMQDLAITLGNVLIPVINDLLQVINPLIDRFSKWAKENPETVATITKVAVGVAGLAFAISGISFVIGGMTKLFGIAKVVMGAYNVVLGISGALSSTASIAIGRSSIALKAYNITTKIITAAQWLWNAAMAANPLGLILVAVLAVGAAVWALSKAFSSQTRAQKLNSEVTKRALENTIDQRVEVILLFKALRKAEVGSSAYNKTLEKLEQIQPGIVKQFNLQLGAIEDLNRAEIALTANIMKRGVAQAQAEIFKEKIKEQLISAEEGPGFWQQVAGFFAGEVVKQALHATELQGRQQEIEILGEQIAQTELETINPKAAQQESLEQTIKESKESITVDFKNLPAGAEVTSTGGTTFATPSLGTTNQ